jgi:hypothetical protein
LGRSAAGRAAAAIIPALTPTNSLLDMSFIADRIRDYHKGRRKICSNIPAPDGLALTS